MIEWGTKQVGSNPVIDLDGAVAVVMGSMIGNSVKVPGTGEQARIVDAVIASCPKCQVEAVTYILSNGMYVAECGSDNEFVFYRRGA